MRALAAILLGLTLIAANAARAEKVALHSTTYPNIGAVLRGTGGKPVTVPANLQFPARAAARYPAVVVVHTIGGYDENNEGWFAARLREAGYATLTYDSFAARGLGNVTKGNNPSLSASAVADAYAGLNLLASQPKIDPAHIAVVGFSFGGEVAHLTALTPLQHVLSPQHRFAAHVGFYPGWVFGTVGKPGAYTGAPILFLFGGKDDITPWAKVHGYLDYLAKTGTKAPIESKTYPDAHHAWTNSRMTRVRFFPEHGNTRKCPMLLIGRGKPRFLVGGTVRDFNQAEWHNCVQESRGYAMGFDAAVRAQSLKDMLAFLNKHIGH
jgi:dienelactone hydrolase